ncbi:MAG: hypothetical protein J1F02_08670 [Lachnospiraceae bacterium]|nr:hypothetical protein [Lachnospiraceae bacterium]
MILYALLLLCLLLFFPETALAGSRYGATLWLTQLLPTLLPFFIAIQLFRDCLPGVASRRLFLLTGLLCGYPAGAALVMNQYEQRLLERRQAYFFLGFVNNPSPMFVIAFCGITLLGLSVPEAFSLFVLLVLSSFLGSLMFLGILHGTKRLAGFYPAYTAPSASSATKATGSSLSFSARMDRIILDSFVLLTKIGGYVILFSIFGQFIGQILDTGSLSSLLCSGAMEITSGVSYLPEAILSTDTKKVLMVMILSFGGLSAAAQTGSILTKSELSILPYILNKGINSLVAGLLSLIWFL